MPRVPPQHVGVGLDHALDDISAELSRENLLQLRGQYIFFGRYMEVKS